MTADAYLVIRCDAADDTEIDGRCGAEGSWPVRFVEPHTHREFITGEEVPRYGLAA